jgi:mRNA interferase RelE/StbE
VTATWGIDWSEAAERQLAKLDQVTRRRILKSVEKLSSNPCPSGAVRLVTDPGVWRMRVGDYRLLYEIIEQQVRVLIVKIGHRRDVYER